MRFFILALLLSTLVYLTSGSLIGIDFGSKWIKVAMAQTGAPIDIVENESSRRKSPNMIGFGEERAFSDAAALHLTKSPQNVIEGIKGFLGVPLSEINTSSFMFNITEDDRSVAQFNVPGVDRPLSPEEVAGMILGKSRAHATAQAGRSIKDCVISVPSYFTSSQVYALNDALNLAGLNTLGMITDQAACALQYLMSGKIDIKEVPAEGSKVMFIDGGDSSLQVSVVSFAPPPLEKKTKFPRKILGTVEVIGYGRTTAVNGRDFDLKIVDILAEKFMVKNPTLMDPRETPRSLARLRKEATKIKEILSANPEVDAHIESLLDDKDLHVRILRAEVEEAWSEMLQSVDKPIHDALRSANVDPVDLVAVEVIGGMTRVPSISTVLKTALGRDTLDRQLNGDEAVAFGAALYAATLSTQFRVSEIKLKEFALTGVNVTVNEPLNVEESKQEVEKAHVTIDVEDTLDVGVGKPDLYTDTEGEPVVTEIASSEVVAVGSRLSSRRKITFSHDKDMDVILTAVRPRHYSDGDQMGVFHVSGMETATNNPSRIPESPVTVSLSVRTLSSGVAVVDRGEAKIEVEVDVEVEVEESADEPLVIDVIDANAAEDLAGKQVDPIEAEKAEEKEEKVEGEKFEEKVEENEEKLEEDIIEAKEEEVVESKESESEEEVVEEKVEGVQVQDKAGEVEEGITEIKPEQKKQTIIEKQVQSKKYPLKITAISGPKPAQLTNTQYRASQELLGSLDAQDKSRFDKQEEINALETYVYAVKEKIYSDEGDELSTEEGRELMLEALSEAGDWVYDEGLDANLDVVQEKRQSLVNKCGSFMTRIIEQDLRPKAVESLEKLIIASTQLVQRWEDETAESLKNETAPRLTEKDLEKVRGQIDSTKEWLTTKKAKQEELKPFEDPALLSTEANKEERTLQREMEYYARKKTKKPKVNKKKKDKKSEEKKIEETTEEKENKTIEETTEPTEEVSSEESS